MWGHFLPTGLQTPHHLTAHCVRKVPGKRGLSCIAGGDAKRSTQENLAMSTKMTKANDLRTRRFASEHSSRKCACALLHPQQRWRCAMTLASRLVTAPCLAKASRLSVHPWAAQSSPTWDARQHRKPESSLCTDGRNLRGCRVERKRSKMLHSTWGLLL